MDATLTPWIWGMQWLQDGRVDHRKQAGAHLFVQTGYGEQAHDGTGTNG